MDTSEHNNSPSDSVKSAGGAVAWHCSTCGRDVLPVEVTYTERHAECGTFIGQPTTVSVEAVLALVGRWRAEDVNDGTRTVFRSATKCADELQALTEKANG